MSTQDHQLSARKIISFAGQLIVLIVCVWYIEFIYFANIYPDKQVKSSFEQTTCTIAKATMATSSEMVRLYRADFLLKYVAQGVSYQEWVSGNGLDRSFNTNEEWQESLLKQFPIGGKFPCWYNPQTPLMVVLVPRHVWSSTFLLFIPMIIALMMGCYCLRDIVRFIALLRKK